MYMKRNPYFHLHSMDKFACTKYQTGMGSSLDINQRTPTVNCLRCNKHRTQLTTNIFWLFCCILSYCTPEHTQSCH